MLHWFYLLHIRRPPRVLSGKNEKMTFTSICLTNLLKTLASDLLLCNRATPMRLWRIE